MAKGSTVKKIFLLLAVALVAPVFGSDDASARGGRYASRSGGRSRGHASRMPRQSRSVSRGGRYASRSGGRSRRYSNSGSRNYSGYGGRQSYRYGSSRSGYSSSCGYRRRPYNRRSGYRYSGYGGQSYYPRGYQSGFGFGANLNIEIPTGNSCNPCSSRAPACPSTCSPPNPVAVEAPCSRTVITSTANKVIEVEETCPTCKGSGKILRHYISVEAPEYK